MNFQLPIPTPETRRFWDDAKLGRLTISYCLDTGRYFFYPRPVSPYTGTTNVEWRTISGRGRLHSYIINHRPLPGRNVVSPIIALVKLEEGPSMMSNIVDVLPEPDYLVLDMPLEVRFRQVSPEITLPVFAPATEVA
ncbi:DNA-binding protein [Nocardia nova]|uniref:DNA-binding protein n=1 Tax=Nocardia nova TaxID=37330 RepID=A0A2S6AN61_9NOCA|nr:OB-fold domain-containing protein [Nocardia nova]PPJ25713.1 DNA-binding protein [Nocardia nova]PPJ36660.1 DNA-binding protein [Nocardia nova]